MGILYLVATPIGNLNDITLRALEVLWAVDLILCEDTRETQQMLNEYKEQVGVPYPQLLSYNDHNRAQRIPKIIEMLKQGKRIALVSDRGTPLLSDPGYKLVQKVIRLSQVDSQIQLDTVPGANAILPALQLSGFPPNQFFFAGFLPRQKQKRIKMLKELPPSTIILFESPRRLRSLIEEIQDVYGETVPIVIANDLTKRYQSIYRGKVSKVVKELPQNEIKGEITVVINLNSR